MKCIYCGANIEKEDNFCNTCGSKIEINNYHNISSSANEKKNSNGTVSLVLGIIACVFFYVPFFSIPLGIVSIVLGVNHKKETGSKTAGTILGIISLILTTIVITLLTLFIVWAVNLETEDNYHNDDYWMENETETKDDFLNKYL